MRSRAFGTISLSCKSKRRQLKSRIVRDGELPVCSQAGNTRIGEIAVGYAKEIGLDVSKFEKALDSDKVKQQIAADQAEATKAGANGTPTFFINGRRVVGAVPFDNFKTVIEDELKKAGKGT